MSAIEWLAAQDWVDCIGYYGSSYLALTGWVIADALPDKEKTLYLTQYGTDRHVSAYSAGSFRHDVLTGWAMGNAGFTVEADYLTSCRYRPHMEVDTDLWGGRLDWYRDWISNPGRNDPYWRQGFWQMLKAIPSKVKLPIYFGASWYDHHFGSAIETYNALSNEAKQTSLFRIGVWNHFFMPSVEAYDCQNRQDNDMKTALEWFSSLLVHKNKPKGGISAYVIGTDQWVDRPLNEPYPSYHNYYFDLQHKTGNTFGLSSELPTEPGMVTYEYDPSNPVITQGGEAMLTTAEKIGSLLQPDPGYRADVISLTSEALSEGITLYGKIKATLYVQSDCEDTAFTARIMQVFPDGRTYNIRGGITTLSYRNNADQPLPYQPGEILQINIDFWDIAWKIEKNARIRVDISSSDFPQYAIHTNLPGLWSTQTDYKKAVQTLWSGGEYRSMIQLPCME